MYSIPIARATSYSQIQSADPKYRPDILSAPSALKSLTPHYFMSNLIVSCAQPDAGGPFGDVSGR